MDFTFRRRHGDVVEEIQLQGATPEFVAEMMDRWTGSDARGFDGEGLQTDLYFNSIDMEELQKAYAQVGQVTQERYEEALQRLEEHRPLPKSDGHEPKTPWYQPKRETEHVAPTYPPRTKQFKKQGGELGPVNYATLIECQLCHYVGEGWAQSPDVQIKCHSCKTKLRVEPIHPYHDGANEKGQKFRAAMPYDYLVGMELI